MSSNVMQTVQGRWQQHRRLIISLFLLAYVFTVAVYLSPKSIWRTNFLTPTIFVFRGLGLWQDFVTFAPAPVSASMDLDAVVKFDDGSKLIWMYPRASQMHGLERIVKDKYRRVLYRYMRDSKFLWIALSQYVAREVDSPSKHPVSVSLVMHLTPSAPMSKGAVRDIVLPSNDKRLYVYKVQPKDLRSR